MPTETHREPGSRDRESPQFTLDPRLLAVGLSKSLDVAEPQFPPLSSGKSSLSAPGLPGDELKEGVQSTSPHSLIEWGMSPTPHLPPLLCSHLLS